MSHLENRFYGTRIDENHVKVGTSYWTPYYRNNNMVAGRRELNALVF